MSSSSGSKGDESKMAGDGLAQLTKGGAVLMLCRTCGKKGDHWTIRCPYKDPAPLTENWVDEMWRENTVRVTNLSENTWEPDLRELFRKYGPVNRVCVFKDLRGVRCGFGFVNFVNKEDAERAINKLNGYGYDSQILRVELARRWDDLPR